MDSLRGWLLLIHLVAAIGWLGPALGAWSYVLQRQLKRHREEAQWDRFDDWILVEFTRVLQLEHFSFVLLITSGIALAHASGYLSNGLFAGTSPWWLDTKILVVALIIVPFELFDTFIAHWVIPERLARREEDPEAFAAALRWHDLIVRLGSLVLGLAIPTVLYLVCLRPI